MQAFNAKFKQNPLNSFEDESFSGIGTNSDFAVYSLYAYKAKSKQIFSAADITVPH
jgi:hypothetical protein